MLFFQSIPIHHLRGPLSHLNKVVYIVIIIMALIRPSSLFSQGIPINQDQYLFSRPLMMGGAYTAIGEGSASLAYNPAAIVVPGAHYTYSQLEHKTNGIRNSVGHHLYLAPIALSSQSYQDESLSFESKMIGFGKHVRYGVDWGITYKEVSSIYKNRSYSRSYADFGLLFKVFPYLNFGANFHNIYSNDTDVVKRLDLGSALFLEDNHFLVSMDTSFEKHNGEILSYGRIGTEVYITDSFLLRAGLNSDYYSAGINMGLSFFDLDYGLLYPRNKTKSELYTISFNFGKSLYYKKFREHYALFKPDSYAKFKLGGDLIEGKSEISLFRVSFTF